MSGPDDSTIYHERQSQMLCGLHALNNLLQRRAFSKRDFDEMCDRLDPSSHLFNAHRNWLGLGDYDANVLTMAVESTGLSLQWWDRRRPISELDVHSPTLLGILLNVHSPVRVGSCRVPGLRRPHWLAVRWLATPHDAFFNLDSKLPVPRRIGASAEDIIVFLEEQLQDSRTQVLLVRQQVESEKRD